MSLSHGSLINLRMIARYALYFAPPPDEALWRFGSRILGYDASSGEEIAPPEDAPWGADWASLTQEPRRYGFHATLKAPFELRDAVAEEDLLQAVRDYARLERPLQALPLSVAALGNFVALAPLEPDVQINALAARTVMAFEPFRAPLSDAARQRRLATHLTSRQIWHLDHYGYPYVFEDFRFHMTLTGPVPPARLAELRAHLAAQYAPITTALQISDICVFKQADARSRFRLIHRAPFGPQAQAS